MENTNEKGGSEQVQSRLNALDNVAPKAFENAGSVKEREVLEATVEKAKQDLEIGGILVAVQGVRDAKDANVKNVLREELSLAA